LPLGERERGREHRARFTTVPHAEEHAAGTGVNMPPQMEEARRVGALDRLPRERFGGLQVAAPNQDLRPDAPPERLGIGVLCVRRLLAERSEAHRLVVAALSAEGLSEDPCD